MKTFIYVTEEGITYQPDGSDIENLQVIGISKGLDLNDAYNNLLDERPDLKDTTFSEICAFELVDRNIKGFFYLNQIYETIPLSKNFYISNLLQNYKKLFTDEDFPILENQLKNDENLGTRKNFNGHLTASARILSKDLKKIILIHNISLDKWLAPGGHWEEGDSRMHDNAFREAKEETGLTDLQLHSWHKENNFIPIDIDTHHIPQNDKKQELEHFHHDFRYIFIYNGDLCDTKLQECEVNSYKWLDLDGDFGDFSGKNVIEKIKKVL